MKWMIAEGYEDKRTLGRRIKAMEAWIAKPAPCSQPDADAEYAAVIEIDLADIKEPIARLPERSGRRQAALRSRRRQDRRGLHRLAA